MATLSDYLTPPEGNQVSRVYDITPEAIQKVSMFKPYLYDLTAASATGANDLRFQWDEKDYTTLTTQVNNYGGYSAVATSIVVDDGTIFTVKDRVRNNRSGEVFQVTAISTNTLTVVRGHGSSAATMNDNDELMILGAAMEMASRAPDANMADSTTVYNYLQTIRLSDSFAGEYLRSNGTPQQQFADKQAELLEEILRRIELNLFFGRRNEDTTAFSKYSYGSGGLEQFLSTNVVSVGTTMSESDWIDIMTDYLFKYGSDTKIAFCGSVFHKTFSTYANSGSNNYWVGVQADIGQRLGVNVSEYVSPTGQTLIVKEHELFSQTTGLAGDMFVVDPEFIRLRYAEKTNGMTPDGLRYKTGRLQYSGDLEENDRDGEKFEYFAQIGLQVMNEKFHGYVKGVTGPA